TGALGVNFNRRNWPGSPDVGFYKPHSELWVCPPGICTADSAISTRGVTASSTKAKKKKSAHKKAKKSSAKSKKSSAKKKKSSKTTKKSKKKKA
ncbi:MAG: hypothetical protein QOE11_823, partial [Solirubrobacteraceae bacterium]|nr:hypothetical protein [Solirubrobacteraceae bacterium]